MSSLDQHSAGGTAWLRAFMLATLVVVVFHEALAPSWRAAMHDPEALHVLLVPGLVGVLAWRRRRDLVAAAGRGAPAGLALIVGSLGMFAAAALRWLPEYLGRASIVPALAGAVMCGAGTQAMRRCLPTLMLVLLAIPPGSSFVPFFVVAPNPIVLPALPPAVGLLSGVPIEARGGELFIQTAGAAEPKPLEQFNDHTSSAMLLLGFLATGVFAGSLVSGSPRVFAAVMLAAVPVAVGCDLLRTIGWVTALVHNAEGSGWLSARAVSAAGALAIAFTLNLALARVARQLLAPRPAALGAAGS